MSEPTIWWVLAGGVIAVELITGTVYLLLISLGLAAGAMTAHFGLPTAVQMFVAAVFGGGSVLIWRAYKKARAPVPVAKSEPLANLDVGEIVHVEEWSPEGTGSTKYRGANWQVSLAPGELASSGAYRIAEVTGNRLIVKQI